MTTCWVGRYFFIVTFTPLSRSSLSISPRMRIMIVTDAWFPQTNGVVNTLAQTAAWLVRFGHEVMITAPRDFRTVPCPSYPEIRVAVRPMATLARKLELFQDR